MASLFGQDYTKSELLAHVGKMNQIASVTPFEFTDGFERGSRGLFVENAAGLRFTVMPDRCLDIGSASYRGIPLAWTSSTSFPNPSFYEPDGLGWLRSFGGGLVATCGLTNVGPPTDDKFGQTGQHGRIGNTPAFEVQHGGYWDEQDNYNLVIAGKVREAKIFSENLLLERTIVVPLDKAILQIEDIVTNEGDQPSPLMLLYHCNLGFPLLSADAHLEGDFQSITPRDAEAEQGKENALSFDSPITGYKEKCYWLDPVVESDGKSSVSLVNPTAGLRLTLRYDKSQMPHLTEWKQMGQGTYALGLEPGNVLPLGRAHYIEQNELSMIQPGESRTFSFEIAVSTL